MRSVPKHASVEAQLIETQILTKMFLDEITEQGLTERTKSFLEEFTGIVPDYKQRLIELFNDVIPDDVYAILSASDKKINTLKMQYENSCLNPIFTAAKMAGILIEVRALNHVLGE